MLKPSDYTPARRRIMQGVVWGIFLLTLGLAAVVAETNRRANRVPLTQTVTVDDVTIHLPDQWRTRPRVEDGRTIVQVAEPVGDEEARIISIMCDRLPTPMSPLQYLNSSFGVSLPGASGGDGEVSSLTTVKVAQQPGVLVTILAPPTRRDEFAKDLFACTVLPSQRAVVVHLSGRGPVSLQDRELVKQVAGGIAVAHEPNQAKEDEPITLPRLGIMLTPPRGLSAIDERDPNRSDRLLWPVSMMKQRGQRLEENWATVELVECIVPSHDNMAQSVETLLLVRDPIWRGANVVPEGPNTWRADLAKSAVGEAGDMVFPARAYLLTDANGIGLLAIFRGGFNGGGFENDWKTIAASVKFPDSPALKIAGLEAAGAAEVKRLRDAGYEKLLADRDEQWWLWTCPGDRPHLGWSHAGVSLTNLSGKSETRLRRWGGIVRRITGEFSYRDAEPRYRASATREDAAGQNILQSLQQSTSVTGEQLILGARARGDAPEQWNSTAPPQFVPGALLPLVLAKLPDKPMLLRSESFPGFEAVGAPEPLTLLLEPASTTRKADADKTPMRCVAVSVNGSGQISRWFFRSSGELECVELPGGVQCTSSDQSTLEFDFGKDGQMAP